MTPFLLVVVVLFVFCVCAVVLVLFALIRSETLDTLPVGENTREALVRRYLSLSDGKALSGGPSRPRALVLVVSGAFCPPHREHVLAIREAVLAAQKTLGDPVLAAVMLPSNDKYLGYKFLARSVVERSGKALKWFLPAKERVKLLEIGLAEQQHLEGDFTRDDDHSVGEVGNLRWRGDVSGDPDIPDLEPAVIFAADWEGTPPDWGRIFDLIATLVVSPNGFIKRLLQRCRLSLKRALVEELTSTMPESYDYAEISKLDLRAAFVCGDDVARAIDVSPHPAVVFIRRAEALSRAPDTESSPLASTPLLSRAKGGGPVISVSTRGLGYSSTELRRSMESDRAQAALITYPGILEYLDKISKQRTSSG